MRCQEYAVGVGNHGIKCMSKSEFQAFLSDYDRQQTQMMLLVAILILAAIVIFVVCIIIMRRS